MNRVFVWKSRAWYAPTGATEEIHFGLMDLQTGVWHSRIIARWPDPGSKQPFFQTGLAGMATISHLHGLGRKMEELSRAGISAERFAVLLSAYGLPTRPHIVSRLRRLANNFKMSWNGLENGWNLWRTSWPPAIILAIEGQTEGLPIQKLVGRPSVHFYVY